MLLYFNTALPSGGFFFLPFHFGCFRLVSGLTGKVCNLGGKGSLFSSSSKNILSSRGDTELHHCLRGVRDGVPDSKQQRRRRNIYWVLVGGVKNSLE